MSDMDFDVPLVPQSRLECYPEGTKAALEAALAETQQYLDIAHQALSERVLELDEHRAISRADRAAIRALRDAGQKFTEGDLVDEDGNVSAAYNDAYRGWYAVLSGEHARTIARASREEQ